jgi:predicted AlkP superfamily pyrophosphatase or phosphodiesterase
MINKNSIRSVKEAVFQKEFVRPLYESYGFSRIPSTISDLFNGTRSDSSLPQDAIKSLSSGYDTVILLFLDGFGWRFFEHYLPQYPFLRWFSEEGIATKITSQFPSTTAAHVTCIHTGLDVGTSGVYEWFYYEPSVDRVIAPLLSSYAGDKEINTLEKEGIDIASLYPKKTLYEAFKKRGIHSYILQHINIAHSPYSQAMCKGALYLPFQKLGDGLDSVIELVEQQPQGEKRYICLYVGDIDSCGHRFGLFSSEYEQAVKQIMVQLEERLHAKLKGIDRKAVVLMTADHGMTEVDPKTTIYLNEELPQLLEMLKKNKQGDVIAPAGSCRDFFLHLQDRHLKDAEKLLKDYLGEIAWVVTTKELIERGFFGLNKPSKEFLSRVGNLVLLPYDHSSIWWYEKDRFDQHFFAMHGGLTCAEMESIFLFANL